MSDIKFKEMIDLYGIMYLQYYNYNKYPWLKDIDLDLISLPFSLKYGDAVYLNEVFAKTTASNQRARYSITWYSLFELYGWKYNRMWDAINMEYNPLENYDRWEDTTEDSTNTQRGTDVTKLSNVNESIPQVINTTTYDEAVTTNEQRTATFDSQIYHDKQFDTTTDKAHSITVHNEGKDVVTNEGSENKEHDALNTDELVRKSHVHGNIGVTTSQQMLESELQLALFNFYEEIVKDYVTVYCRGVW